MTKMDLAETASALMDEISADPVNWRAHEDHLRQVIELYENLSLTLPPELRIYAEWLEQDALDAEFENMPI